MAASIIDREPGPEYMSPELVSGGSVPISMAISLLGQWGLVKSWTFPSRRRREIDRRSGLSRFADCESFLAWHLVVRRMGAAQ
jgi:hypothetical protein